MNSADQQEFVSILIDSFPELRNEIQDEIVSGLLHLEMACFARYTQDAIDRGDLEQLIQYYDFADRFFRDANDELKNAFYVSYLEHLNFDEPSRAKAKSLLPSALLQGWVDINNYLEALAQKGLEVEKRKM